MVADFGLPRTGDPAPLSNLRFQKVSRGLMTRFDKVVFVIDDDPSMREAIKTLIETIGLECRTFASGQEFLESSLPDVPSCAVLDVRLPGLSGLNLQKELTL